MKATFHNVSAYFVHFAVPIIGFSVMFFLINLSESAAMAGTQAIGMVLYYTMIQACLIVMQTLKDKEQGVMKRINISPARTLVYVIGNGAAAFLVLAIQGLLLTGFVSFIFPVDIGLRYGQLLAVLMIFNFTCIGFGFLICSVSETSSGAMMLANFVILFSSLMGGSFFPVDFMIPVMQKIALAFPQYWVMNAIRQLQTAAPAMEIGLSLLILILFAVLFIAVQSALRNRRQTID
jgi:ABC-2 type transport system permease protein